MQLCHNFYCGCTVDAGWSQLTIKIVTHNGSKIDSSVLLRKGQIVMVQTLPRLRSTRGQRINNEILFIYGILQKELAIVYVTK